MPVISALRADISETIALKRSPNMTATAKPPFVPTETGLATDTASTVRGPV